MLGIIGKQSVESVESALKIYFQTNTWHGFRISVPSRTCDQLNESVTDLLVYFHARVPQKRITASALGQWPIGTLAAGWVFRAVISTDSPLLLRCCCRMKPRDRQT